MSKPLRFALWILRYGTYTISVGNAGMFPGGKNDELKVPYKKPPLRLAQRLMRAARRSYE